MNRFRLILSTLAAVIVAGVSLSLATTNYPATLDSNSTLFAVSTGQVVKAVHHNNVKDAIIAVETQLGINNSLDPTTIDYILKNAASVDPGHKHTYTSLPLTVGRLDIPQTYSAVENFTNGLTVGSFFTLSAAGDLTKIHGVPYIWPIVQGTPGQALVNNGVGGLSWSTITATAADLPGAIQFNTGGLFDGNSTNLFWNNATNRLGILTNTPGSALDVATKFQVDSTGNLIKLNNVSYSWPAVQGGALTVLQNDGAGNLSWSSIATPVTGAGAAGQVTFWTGGSTISGNNNFYWDNALSRLGLNTAAPTATFDVAGSFLVDSLGMVTSFRDKGSLVFDIRAYGAVCDGLTDDYNAFSDAEIAAAAVQGLVFVPPTSLGCAMGSQLSLSTGVTLGGVGRGSKIIMPAAFGSSYVVTSGTTDVHVRDLSIEGGGAVAGIHAAVDFNSCVNCSVERVFINEPDSVGIRFLDSDNGRIEDNYITTGNVRYAAGANNPTGILLDGTGQTLVSGNELFQVGFGILLHGFSAIGDSESLRASSYCKGNTVSGNHISYHKAHAVSVLTCSANVVDGNTAYKYEGTSHPRIAFQSKSDATPTIDDDSKGNVFSNNTAIDVDTGFGCNDGTAPHFANNSVWGAQYSGADINSCPDYIVEGLTVVNFNAGNNSAPAVIVQASSHGKVNDVTAIPDVAGTATAIGFQWLTAASSNDVDNVTLHGTFDIGLSICNNCGSNSVGPGFRLGSATITTPIVDAVQTTRYPCTYGMEFAAADAGNHFVGRPQRGMTVARITAVTVSTVGGGGSAVLSCGQSSAPTRFINAETLSTVARTAVIYDYNSTPAIANEGNLVAPNYIECTLAATGGAVTSGRVAVQVDGLCGIHPV